MPLAAAIPFYAATACYIAAAVLSLVYLRVPNDRTLFYAKRLAAVGNLGLLIVFLYRWGAFRLVPFTGQGDSLNLFLVLCTGIMLMVQRDPRMRPLPTRRRFSGTE